MDFKLLSLFVIMAIICVVHGGGKTAGTFTLSDKRTCKWKEMNDQNLGKNDRKLQITCNGNKKKNKAPIRCSYAGNPHTCDSYKRSKDKSTFYKCLVNKLKAHDQPCHDQKVSCKKQCPDLEFTKMNKLNYYENLDLDDNMESNSDEVFMFDPEMFEDFEEDDQMFRPYV